MSVAAQPVSVRRHGRVARGRVGPLDALPETLSVAPAIARGFAKAVEFSLQSGVLGYDDRLRLVRRGTRLGLSGFEAMLIIAAVQHRVPGATTSPDDAATESRRHSLAPLAVGVVVQGMILAAAAALFW